MQTTEKTDGNWVPPFTELQELAFRDRQHRDAIVRELGESVRAAMSTPFHDAAAVEEFIQRASVATSSFFGSLIARAEKAEQMERHAERCERLIDSRDKRIRDLRDQVAYWRDKAIEHGASSEVE